MRTLFGLLVVSVVLAPVTPGCGSDGGGLEEPPFCVAGETRCSDDGSKVEVCREDGTAYDPLEQCITGASCQESRCACPGTQVPGSESCVTAGIPACAPWFTPSGDICAVAPGACGAGEIFAGGKCLPVGIQACPEGFEEDAGGSGCVPAEVECDAGKEWYIGKGCLPLGVQLACGDLKTPWATVPDDAETVVYVYSDSDQETEDGSQGAPFKTIQAAVEAAPPGATVMVGTGTYQGGIHIDKPLKLLGKCAEYVTVDAGSHFQPPGYDIGTDFIIFATPSPSSAIEISGLALTDIAGPENGKAAGIYVRGAPSARIHDISFDELSGVALHLDQCNDASGYHLAITDLTTRLVDLGPYGQSSNGVLVEDSTGVTVLNSSFIGTQGSDIRAVNSCPEIMANHFEKRGAFGGLSPVGVWLEGCEEGVSRLVSNRFKAKMTHAILAKSGQVEIIRNYIEGTVTDFDDINGPAVKVDDAKFTIEDNYLVANQYAGIAVKGKTAKGDITGNRIDGTLGSDPGLKGGDGVIVLNCDPGPVILSGNSIVGNSRNGVLVSGSIAKLEHNLIKSTLKSLAPNVAAGAGLNVVEGSDALIKGNVFDGNYGHGIRFGESYGLVEGNVIAGTISADGGFCSGGITAIDSLMGKGIIDNLISGNQTAGIFLFNTSVDSISGNVIDQTIPGDGSKGAGMIGLGSTVNVAENWIRGNHDMGVYLDTPLGSAVANVFESNGTGGAGGGLVVVGAEKMPFDIEGNTFTDNGFAGLVVASSQFEAVKNAFVDNAPNEGGVGGVGAWIQNGSEGGLRLNFVADNQAAGFYAYAADDVTMGTNLIIGTAVGSIPGGDVPIKMADGVAVTGGAFVSVLHNLLKGNAAAGVAFLNGEGVISNNELIDNGTYGLHLVKSQPTVKKNQYDGNLNGDISSEADRMVPAYEFALPEPCTFN